MEKLQKVCPICGTPQFHLMQKVKDPSDDDRVYIFWLCNCGICYNGVVLDHSTYDAWASNRYSERGGEDWISQDEETRADRVEMEIKDWYIQSKLDRPARIADIGAARGHLLDRLSTTQKGAKVTAIGPEDKLDTDQDLITCIHVLEHIDEPYEFLRPIRKHCKGVFWVEVPALGHYNSYQPYHAIIYSTWTLGKVLKNAGFTLIDIWLGYDPMRDIRQITAISIGDDNEKLLQKIVSAGNRRQVVGG
jgi:hypothetical protein